ncbi:PTS system, beta-glucosides-specific IIA component [Streptococcus pyogenes]|nr:PTS system, beta-glucosides-specific IIA component [Streptococcus pyogenes]
MTYQETAKAILAAVGGKTNIQRVTHCGNTSTLSTEK